MLVHLETVAVASISPCSVEDCYVGIQNARNIFCEQGTANQIIDAWESFDDYGLVVRDQRSHALTNGEGECHMGHRPDACKQQ